MTLKLADSLKIYNKNPLHIEADFCYNDFMNWAAKRKLQYFSGVFGVFLIILFIFLYPVIFKKPSCTDGKLNGDEVGLDCGGSCSRMCPEKTSEPLILWNRAFRISDNAYNLVAFIENTNKNSGISKISYEFRIYDVNNRLIGRRQGNTYIPPNKQFVIFEPHFDPGEAIVKSVSFEFVPPFDWIKREPTIDKLPIFADNIVVGADRDNPNLTARIKNESIYDIPAFDIIAILYDADHNAINVSKTFKEGLNSNSSLSAFFTWPESFTNEAITKDVLIQINPFKVSF